MPQGKAYPPEVRRQCIYLALAGKSLNDIGIQFKVYPETITKWLSLYRRDPEDFFLPSGDKRKKRKRLQTSR